ncbi:hypothetical protein JCM8097_008670 [Rhodosporidiobolus ruineniae]
MASRCPLPLNAFNAAPAIRSRRKERFERWVEQQLHGDEPESMEEPLAELQVEQPMEQEAQPDELAAAPAAVTVAEELAAPGVAVEASPVVGAVTSVAAGEDVQMGVA